jgi:hypothetical protein
LKRLVLICFFFFGLCTGFVSSYRQTLVQGYVTDSSTQVTVENYPYLTQPESRGGYAYFLWKDPYSEQPVKLRLVALR